MSPCRLLVGVALTVGCVGVAAGAIEPDSIHAHLTIPAMAYDDGFGTGLREPSGIWLDTAAGEVFVADAANGRVVIYDRGLTALYSFRHYVQDPVSGFVHTGQPKGVAVTSQGDIALIDAVSDHLDLLDFRGRVIDHVRLNQLVGDTALHLKAACITADAADQFYVAVNGDLTTVLVLDADLGLIRVICDQVDSAHQLNTPVGIAVYNGRVFVGDLYGLPAVKVFDTLGGYLFGFGNHDVERPDLTFPGGFGFLDDGSGSTLILVMDAIRQVVKVYADEGTFITMIGGQGRLPGQFQYPSGLVSDGRSNFYVLERIGRRVQKFQLK
jgi:DNA-binding beta-propeller fold protein YncE